VTGLSFRRCPVVLAAPSGTGKTTIARELVERNERFTFSVSATTRPARAGEQHGVDYEFVSEEAFQEMIRDMSLVEWARVHGNLYGTPRQHVEAAQDRGQHVVLDIDVQGAMQIRTAIPDAVLIFIFPPSGKTLLERLGGRSTEADVEVARRLRNARQEMERAADFDYIVVNDALEHAVARVKSVVEAESQRPSRASNLEEEVRRLRTEIDEVLAEGEAPSE